MPKFKVVTRELLALHFMLQKLGYTADQLFVHVFADAVQFELRAGDKTFVVDVPNPEALGTGAVVDEWAIALTWWNQRASPTEREQVLETSQFRPRAVELIMALTAKGMYPLKGAKR